MAPVDSVRPTHNGERLEINSWQFRTHKNMTITTSLNPKLIYIL